VGLGAFYRVGAERRRHKMATQLNSTEARQRTLPGAMFWALVVFLALAVIAGLVLAVEWVSLPSSGTP
jgi:hypothetical protein